MIKMIKNDVTTSKATASDACELTRRSRLTSDILYCQSRRSRLKLPSPLSLVMPNTTPSSHTKSALFSDLGSPPAQIYLPCEEPDSDSQSASPGPDYRQLDPISDDSEPEYRQLDPISDDSEPEYRQLDPINLDEDDFRNFPDVDIATNSMPPSPGSEPEYRDVSLHHSRSPLY
jgi:hypothetical protein